MIFFPKQKENHYAKQIKELRKYAKKNLHPYLRLAFCFGFTMFSFRSLKFNELVRNLPEGECTARLGGLRLWCLHRSPSLGLGLTPRSLGRSLSGNARVRFGFSCLANFGWGQNSPNTLRPQPRKNSLNKPFLFYTAAKNL